MHRDAVSLYTPGNRDVIWKEMSFTYVNDKIFSKHSGLWRFKFGGLGQTVVEVA